MNTNKNYICFNGITISVRIKTDGRVRLEGKMSEGRAVRKKNINFLKEKNEKLLNY